MKIIQKIKNWYAKYKAENLVFKQYEIPVPKWETWVFYGCGAYNFVYIFINITNYPLLEPYHYTINKMFGIMLFLITIKLGSQARREFKSVWAYYKDKKKTNK